MSRRAGPPQLALQFFLMIFMICSLVNFIVVPRVNWWVDVNSFKFCKILGQLNPGFFGRIVNVPYSKAAENQVSKYLFEQSYDRHQ